MWMFFGMDKKSMSEFNSALERYIEKLLDMDENSINDIDENLVEAKIKEILDARPEDA